jgi:hypothetical protein
MQTGRVVANARESKQGNKATPNKIDLASYEPPTQHDNKNSLINPNTLHLTSLYTLSKMVDASDVVAFDKYILSKSYVSGFAPSQADVAALAQMKSAPTDKQVHALRWYNHINSFAADARAAWPAAGAEPVAAAEEEDDDDDLFGSDDEDGEC